MPAFDIRRLLTLIVFLILSPADTRAEADRLSSLLYARMKYLTHTQNILAGNIANSDTPGYTSKRAETFRRALKNSGADRPTLTATHPAHITAIKHGAYSEIENPYSAPMKPNGNNIDIEQEITDMNFNELQHRQASQLTSKLRQLATTALGESR